MLLVHSAKIHVNDHLPEVSAGSFSPGQREAPIPLYASVICFILTSLSPQRSLCHLEAISFSNRAPLLPVTSQVDVQFVRMTKRFIPLSEIKAHHLAHKADGGPLKNMMLFTRQRLSIQPLTQGKDLLRTPAAVRQPSLREPGSSSYGFFFLTFSTQRNLILSWAWRRKSHIKKPRAAQLLPSLLMPPPKPASFLSLLAQSQQQEPART